MIGTRARLRFVLEKRNVETMDAIHRLSRACARGARGSGGIYLAIDLQVNPMAPLPPLVPRGPNAQPSAFSVAGIKDKRGVTTQFVTACATAVSARSLLTGPREPFSQGGQKMIPW